MLRHCFHSVVLVRVNHCYPPQTAEALHAIAKVTTAVSTSNVTANLSALVIFCPLSVEIGITSPALLWQAGCQMGKGGKSLSTLGVTKGNHADRKSTRLNSSHANISYAVFCLKKKKKHEKDMHTKQISNDNRSHKT